MANWYKNTYGAVWGERYTLRQYPDTYTFPFTYAQQQYDNNNRPYAVTLYRATSGSYVGRHGNINVLPTATTSVLIYKGSYTPYETYGTGSLFISDSDLKSVDSYLTQLETTYISGLFRFKTNILEQYSNLLSGSCYPLTVSINGVTYNYITFTGNRTWLNGFGGEGGSGTSVAVFNNYGEVGTEPTDYTLLNTDVTSATIKEEYYNMVWDFGSLPQETTEVFMEWLLSVADPIYPYSYTVKTYSGDEVLSFIAESPSMINANLTVVGKQKTLVLTGANNREYTLRWESDTPEGKVFLGLSNTAKTDRVVLPANTSIGISWEGVVLYESYGAYRPPATTFDINLYKNSSEVNRVDKGMFLEGVGTLSGALRDECSLITPSIVYQSSDVPTFNYVYIPIFNRYYFVTSLSSVGKNVWRMELNCDVLMTYKDAIFMLQGVVGRQENEFNPLLVDTEIPAQSNPIVQVIDIPSDAFNTQTSDGGHNFLMTVIGA